MRTPRLYFPNACQPGEKAELSPEQAHHVLRVLRRTVGDSLVLFDGTGQSFEAKVCSTAPRGKGGQVEVLGKAVSEAAPITPLRLAQAMLRLY